MPARRRLTAVDRLCQLSTATFVDAASVHPNPLPTGERGAVHILIVPIMDGQVTQMVCYQATIVGTLHRPQTDGAIVASMSNEPAEVFDLAVTLFVRDSLTAELFVGDLVSAPTM